MNYYQRIKDLREDNDKSQEDIAKILEIKQQQYSRYEAGINKMPIDKYIILAEYYNISIDYLCGILETPRKLHEN